MTPLEQAISRDASCTWLDKVDVSTLEGADMAAVDRRMLLAELAVAKSLLQEAYDYGTLWKGNRIYRFVKTDLDRVLEQSK